MKQFHQRLLKRVTTSASLTILLAFQSAYADGKRENRRAEHDGHASPESVVKSLNGLAGQISLQAGSNVTIVPVGNSLRISAASSGCGINFPTWHRDGDAASPGSFLGTLNDQPLELKVNGQRALRLEPNTNDAPNVIAGSSMNWVAAGSLGVVIGGGGSMEDANEVAAHFGVIAGGRANFITSGCPSSFIGGGYSNFIDGNSPYGTVGGGWINYISFGSSATVGGGIGNGIAASAGTIAGGDNNTIARGSNGAAIAGGTVGCIHENSPYSAILGGWQNTIVAGAPYAIIPGGRQNQASAMSFAAGTRAKANHAGDFVWADSSDFDFVSSEANQFAVRSTGGAAFVTGVDGVGNATAGVLLPAGSGSWASLSDRNTKENLKLVSGRDVLEKVCNLPLTSWNYKSQDKSIRHLGPMAQDFHAAFGVGEDEKHIATLDADGVALAAIQGLNQKLEAQNAELQARLEKLERLVVAQNRVVK